MLRKRVVVTVIYILRKQQGNNTIVSAKFLSMHKHFDVVIILRSAI